MHGEYLLGAIIIYVIEKNSRQRQKRLNHNSSSYCSRMRAGHTAQHAYTP